MSIEKKFDKLEEEFFHGWVRRHPLLATEMGFHDDFDEEIPSGTYASVMDDIKFLKKYQKEFEKLDGKKFSPQRGVDLELARQTIRLWLVELEDYRLWAKMPQAPRVIGECIFQLLSRNYIPLKKRLKFIMVRLQKLPAYIDRSRDMLREPCRTFIEHELETITRLPGFFHIVKDIARNALPMATFERMSGYVEEVLNALERYSDWLIIDLDPICGNDFAAGEEVFRKLLKARGITESPSTLLAWGEKEMVRQRDKLKELARKIKRKATPEDVRDMIRQNHHDHFDGIMRYVRDQVHRSRQFVLRSKFAPVPKGESLVVTETPSYLRHFLPHGGYWPPAPFEEKREGFYFVTPGDCDSDRLKEHNYSALSNMTIHEGYPGHHLRSVWQVQHKSLIRHLARAPETAEGWAHYCEERVKDLGYEDTPANRFMMVNELHWRAARVVLDIRLHLGKITIPKAVEFLIDETGMDRVTCEAEVRRYLITPTVPLSYLYGKERMKELRKHTREKMKARFDENFFHESVLKAGAIPLSILRKDLDWRIDIEVERLKVEAAALAQEKKTVRRKKAEKAKAKAKAKPKPKAKGKAKPKPKPKKKAKAKARPKPRGK